jgi:hypothetical protein
MYTLLKTLTKNQIEIIKAVLYFNIFNHPLTRHELYENSAITVDEKHFNDELDQLIENNILKQHSDFILSIKSSENTITKRLLGNKGAEEIMPTALKYSRIVASFPFVEGVCLSGSLSKNHYDEKSDLDLFIISKPNRLWICRTLLIVAYKLLPKNKKKFWCVNYFIAADSLFIPDNNPFSGTELAYLIPTINYSVYLSLLKENSWYKTRFPNKNEISMDKCINTPNPFHKKAIEKLLSSKLGDWLDDLLLSKTLKHWQKKYPELAAEDFELQFRSRKSVCKRHTKGYQNKVLKLWDEKLMEYEALINISLK